MASFKSLVIASFFISSLVLLHLVQAIPYQAPTPAPSPTSAKIDCGLACKARCSESSRQNLCLRACNTCCGRCNCVPSGTSGNYDECACYASLTTHHNKRKCP